MATEGVLRKMLNTDVFILLSETLETDLEITSENRRKVSSVLKLKLG